MLRGKVKTVRLTMRKQINPEKAEFQNRFALNCSNWQICVYQEKMVVHELRRIW